MGVDTVGIGRPRIGPKVQSAVPDEVAHYIEAQAELQEVEIAVVVREMIVESYFRRRGRK